MCRQAVSETGVSSNTPCPWSRNTDFNYTEFSWFSPLTYKCLHFWRNPKYSISGAAVSNHSSLSTKCKHIFLPANERAHCPALHTAALCGVPSTTKTFGKQAPVCWWGFKPAFRGHSIEIAVTARWHFTAAFLGCVWSVSHKKSDINYGKLHRSGQWSQLFQQLY